MDLIDDYRLNVNPVILGNGKPLFGELNKQIRLQLLDSKAYASGVVGLRYQPGGR